MLMRKMIVSDAMHINAAKINILSGINVLFI